MKTYNHLAEKERYQIYSLMQMGHSQKEIAEHLNRSPSTISRELSRNKGQRGYRPKQACGFALKRYKGKVSCRIIDSTWERVESLIQQDYSPEQVSGYLKVERGISISHEWIYKYLQQDKLAGGSLFKHLRCQKRRKKRYGSKNTRGQIKNRVSIEERPAEVDEKSTLGHWEADTVIGKQTAGKVFVTLVERVSRKVVIGLADSKSAADVTREIIRKLIKYQGEVKSITFDNGKEFAYHEKIAKRLDTACYFAHPYHSWERGLNENTNGLVRQYAAKGSDFNLLSRKNVYAIEKKLNERPRKSLGFKTPEAVFRELKQVALGS